MARESPKSVSYHVFILLSCTALLSQIGSCANDQLVGQKFFFPGDPQGCIQSVSAAGVCLTDFWTSPGKPSAQCCKALKGIDASCWPALLPFLNPFFAPFINGLCAGAGGSGGSGGALPFPPIFPVPSTTPPPPFVGGAGAPPPPSVGGAGAPPPKTA